MTHQTRHATFAIRRAAALALVAGLAAGCAHSPLTAPCEPGRYASAASDCERKPINAGIQDYAAILEGASLESTSPESDPARG